MAVFYFEAPVGKGDLLPSVGRFGHGSAVDAIGHVCPSWRAALTCQGCHEPKLQVGFHEHHQVAQSLCKERRQKFNPNQREPTRSITFDWCSRCWINIASSATKIKGPSTFPAKSEGNLAGPVRTTNSRKNTVFTTMSTTVPSLKTAVEASPATLEPRLRSCCRI